MVSISENENQVTFNIIGFHKILALKNKIIVNKNDLFNVYQNKQELERYAGWRLGTFIPHIITTGTFTNNKTVTFWDVCNKNDTIIIELKNHALHKLYIQVENPAETIAFLQNLN